MTTEHRPSGEAGSFIVLEWMHSILLNQNISYSVESSPLPDNLIVTHFNIILRSMIRCSKSYYLKRCTKSQMKTTPTSILTVISEGCGSNGTQTRVYVLCWLSLRSSHCPGCVGWPIILLAVVWGEHCVIGRAGLLWRQSAPLAVSYETESQPGGCLFLPHST
jgi:hypothetical protein